MNLLNQCWVVFKNKPRNTLTVLLKSSLAVFSYKLCYDELLAVHGAFISHINCFTAHEAVYVTLSNEHVGCASSSCVQDTRHWIPFEDAREIPYSNIFPNPIYSPSVLKYLPPLHDQSTVEAMYHHRPCRMDIWK
jgi:hypothetical protein